MDLTKHLTTRADGRRATPVKKYSKALLIFYKLFKIIFFIQRLVRFCADYRIKPHAPPLVVGPRQFL